MEINSRNQPLAEQLPVHKRHMPVWVMMVIFGLILAIIWYGLGLYLGNSLGGAIFIIASPVSFGLAYAWFFLFFGGLLVPVTKLLLKMLRRTAHKEFILTYILLFGLLLVALPIILSWYHDQKLSQQSQDQNPVLNITEPKEGDVLHNPIKLGATQEHALEGSTPEYEIFDATGTEVTPYLMKHPSGFSTQTILPPGEYSVRASGYGSFYHPVGYSKPVNFKVIANIDPDVTMSLTSFHHPDSYTNGEEYALYVDGVGQALSVKVNVSASHQLIKRVEIPLSISNLEMIQHGNTYSMSFSLPDTEAGKKILIQPWIYNQDESITFGESLHLYVVRTKK